MGGILSYTIFTVSSFLIGENMLMFYTMRGIISL